MRRVPETCEPLVLQFRVSWGGDPGQSVSSSSGRGTQADPSGQRWTAHLSPYSSDLNLIELAWVKFKQHLRRAKARSVEALKTAVTAAPETLTAENAVAWFRHCGYRDIPTRELL
jgi:hypothetical protein